MSKKNLAVLFGGVSSEHEVSLSSAFNVLSNLNKEKYNIYPIGITKKGEWLFFEGDYEKILNNTYHEEGISCYISPDRVNRGLFISDGRHIDIDVIFPVLHGKNGEDGTIQGLFELAAIPYVGCNVISSANCMDKIVTKILLEAGGIKTTPFVHFTKEDMGHFSEIAREVEEKLTFPVFVKPSNAGSSVGVSKVNRPADLQKAVELALESDSRILIETGIVAKEVECAVLGNYTTITGVPGEVDSGVEFYDYEAKYKTDTSSTYIPARIGVNVLEEVQELAKRAFALLGCSGLSRVDFFVNDEGILLNEINTLPGFTPISMYPKMMKTAGVQYSDLLDKLIALAEERVFYGQ